MKKSEMDAKVKAELDHIPEWPGDHQSELRYVYAARRKHCLGKKADRPKTPGEVLHECIDSLSQNNPDFRAEYDKEFFDRPEDRG
jgi:hypothetical protein